MGQIQIQHQTNEQTRQSYISIGSIERFPARVGRRVQVRDLELAVFRLSDGRLYALENKSPHRKGGIICEGIVSGDYLFDPLYDWKIYLPDGKVQAPDEGQVRSFPVLVENGEVKVLL